MLLWRCGPQLLRGYGSLGPRLISGFAGAFRLLAARGTWLRHIGSGRFQPAGNDCLRTWVR